MKREVFQEEDGQAWTRARLEQEEKEQMENLYFGGEATETYRRKAGSTNDLGI